VSSQKKNNKEYIKIPRARVTMDFPKTVIVVVSNFFPKTVLLLHTFLSIIKVSLSMIAFLVHFYYNHACIFTIKNKYTFK